MKQVYVYMSICGSYHMVAGPIHPAHFGGLLLIENPLPHLADGEDCALNGISFPAPFILGGDKNVS
jgi:hypothetical protein